MVMLDFQVHLDDGGSIEDQPVIVFAGFRSTAREWAKFTKEWTMALAGPPRAEHLHMADLLAGKDIYEGWSEPDKAGLIERAVSVICRRTQFAVARAIYRDDYEAAVHEAGINLEQGPVLLCLMECVQAFLGHLPKGLNQQERVAFVIDRGPKRSQNFQKRVMEAWSDFERFRPVDPRLGTVTFGNKQEILPLQAADLIAHQAFQLVRDRAKERGVFPGPLKPIFNHVPHDAARIRGVAIERFLRKVRQLPEVQSAEWS